MLSFNDALRTIRCEYEVLKTTIAIKEQENDSIRKELKETLDDLNAQCRTLASFEKIFNDTYNRNIIETRRLKRIIRMLYIEHPLCIDDELFVSRIIS